MNEKPREIVCPSCRSRYFLKSPTDAPPSFCPFCRADLQETSSAPTTLSDESSQVESQSLSDASVQFTIGSYQVLKCIGKGGMGEVFLAYDPICGRKIAIKRIRTDLHDHKNLHQRFIREARITSQLTHPSIIPIYSIHEEKDTLYYTMPYVDGNTLKEILRKAKKIEKKGEKPDSIGAGIQSLTRVLEKIAQAIAYAHAQGVLHRDIKPENIIVGKYGEVMILDWGLAKIVGKRETYPVQQVKEEKDKDITIIGKVVGTVSYMAPERALGHPATHQTDIYSLGVILYWILTLHSPFKRGSLQDFRENMDKEELPEPSEVAPYRDVPPMLSQICKKALAPSPQERYMKTEELIHDLENYIDGRSEWFEACRLNPDNKEDWEFQENVLIAEHAAITRHAERSDWVSLMISKFSFSDNMKLEAKVKVHTAGKGIGFLVGVPETEERRHLIDGYCLWISTTDFPETKLLRSNVEVLSAPEIVLQPDEWYQIRIEKLENNLYFFLDDSLQFSYISHRPLLGTHVGVISRDANYTLDDLYISMGNQNIMVNCLAIPDAFLAHKHYELALTEYRRIAYAFPGRAEGREALFRAGFTLLDCARTEQDPQYYDLALKEFEKLHSTPGAPLEYLGKGLVYKALDDLDEEIKCYTLAFRRYRNHPLLEVLKEQVVYRMHECSRSERAATYQLILLVCREIPKEATNSHTKTLFKSLTNHWEQLPFLFEEAAPIQSNQMKNLAFSIPLSFWLARPYFLEEILKELLEIEKPHPIHVGNALYSLIELGANNLADQVMNQFIKERPERDIEIFKEIFAPLQICTLFKSEPERAAGEGIALIDASFERNTFRAACFLLDNTLHAGEYALFYETYHRLMTFPLTEEQRLRMNCFYLWALLREKKWEEAREIFHTYPLEKISQENSILFFLYGCWLEATEGETLSKIHFSSSLDVSFPRTWSLGTHYILGKLGELWMQNSFLWERRHLYRQLSLYAHCKGDMEAVQQFKTLEKEEYILL